MPSITGTLTASGDSTALITAPTGCTIRVLGYQIMGASAAITVTIKTGSTVRATVLIPSSGVGGISCSPGREPYFQSAPGETTLVINLSAGGATVAYNIQYSSNL